MRDQPYVRADCCSAPRVVTVVFKTGRLGFCVHHFTRHEPVIREDPAYLDVQYPYPRPTEDTAA